jgi:beta-aspartyl-peptidase (threonine type)
MVGPGADDFARKMGMESGDLRSPARIGLYEKRLRQLREGEGVKFFPRLREISEAMDLGTVGAVAMDAAGLIAAATSTGGAMMKLPGRVGDSAVIGAGTYANARGAVSVTGHGEPIIRHALGKVAVDAIGESGSTEGIRNIAEWGRRQGVRFGIIGVDSGGAPAFGFTTEAMSWAVIANGRLSTFLSPS